MTDMRKHVRVDNHGTLMLVHPLTDEAREALEGGQPEDAMWMGGALVVEPRYLGVVLQYLAGELTDWN